jgi:hypothetical protein
VLSRIELEETLRGSRVDAEGRPDRLRRFVRESLDAPAPEDR